MPWAAAAVVGGAAISAYSSGQQSDAVAEGQDKSIEAQQQAQAQLRSDLAPYTSAGTNALAPAQALLGLSGPEAAQSAMADFQKSPGYDFQFNEGMRAVQSGAAAQGMLNSGATLKALQQRGQQLANQDFGTYYNRLMGMVQTGQNSAAGVGASGVQTAGGVAQTLASGASTQASIYGNAAQGIGNAVNNGANNYAYNQSIYGQQKPNALAPTGDSYGGDMKSWA
jgi:hypothetical protein